MREYRQIGENLSLCLSLILDENKNIELHI